ncbi:MAG: hypothetical protein M4579_004586 [Chaenotheca gracillima]|nr:MAG: hypothetical protein M4579_004586 [Chaenotheca gracillima]
MSIADSESQPDAGLRSLDHYKSRLPRWRHNLRQRLIPLVRWETPYLAWAQQKFRSPALDSYFAVTANLGTHTFFMVVLPILFWCGYTNLGRGMVHILAAGVFFSGFVKDLLCLPRPLSPPLQRITMSGSAALEYGFPSTHTTNAVSVAVYALFFLNDPDSTLSPKARLFLEVLSYAYALSIILGRLYCGMHGFMDVLVGGLLGALLSLVQCVYGQAIDEYLYSDNSVVRMIVVIAVIFALVRIHPEPADDCPCFDDSVSFAGVMVGCELGNWHYGASGWAWDFPVPATVPFRLDDIGWPKVIARILLGVVTIFLWREVMKPALHKGLPPLFRVIERLGLNLPRRFFIQASEYKKVPSHLKDDNLIPSVSELPAIITLMRHPRKRAVSVGPQSAADVHETLAYREKRRRESVSSQGKSPLTYGTGAGIGGDRAGLSSVSNPSDGESTSMGVPSLRGALPSPTLARVDTNEQMMGQNVALYTPDDAAPAKDVIFDTNIQRSLPTPSLNESGKMEHENEQEEREMFLQLEKPRVRYDVEVVSKLIVYSGIGWLAVEVNPILFELVGLGLNGLTQ